MSSNGCKQKKTCRKRRGSRTAAIIGCVLGVFILAAAAYALWESPPGRDESGLLLPSNSPAPATNAPEHAAAASPEADETALDRDEDEYTFLLVGKDKGGANTDTILVGKLNTRDHTIDVVSIPRDTLVNISIGVKKVNVLYELDLNSGGNGVDGLNEGIRDLLGFYVDCYAVVDLTAFEKLVDAIGGVYYDVPVDMYYNDPDQNLSINIPAGYQWLSGADALKVVRYRAGYADADIGRIRTQQDFLKSVAGQLLTIGNIPNLKEASDIFLEYVDTDLSSANIAFCVREFLLCNEDDINFYTLPGNYADSVGGFSYVTLYLDEWLDMVNAYLNPWNSDVTYRNVNILTRVNGLLTATTGSIAGGENSFLTMDEYLASLRGGDVPEDSGGGDIPEETADGGAIPDPPADGGEVPGNSE